MTFRDSDALFPSGELRAKIEPDYLRECRLLFADRPFPHLDEVIARLEQLREFL